MEKEKNNLEILRQRLESIVGIQTVKFNGDFRVHSISEDLDSCKYRGDMEIQRGANNYFVVTAGERDIFGDKIRYAFIQTSANIHRLEPLVLQPEEDPNSITIPTSSYGEYSCVKIHSPIKFLEEED